MAVYNNPLVLDPSGLTIKPSDADDYSIGGNVTIGKNLNVAGNIISRDEERVLVQDAFLDVNFGMTSTAAEPGGLNVVYKAVAAAVARTNLAFVARTGTDRAKITDAGSGLPVLSSGDIVQVSNTLNGENDGLYVVHSSTTAQMEMRAVPTFADTVNFKPAQNDLTAVADDASSVSLTHVNCSVLQVDASGLYQTAEGSTDGDFASFASLSGSLQDAYIIGDTITTNGSQGDVVIAGTEKLDVTATNGVSVTNALNVGGLASLDGGIDMDGAFTVADTSGNVVTSGTLQSGAATLASAKVSDLTAGRVVLAGTAGEIEDSANMTFDGSTLALTGAVDASGSVAAGTMTIDGGSILDSSGSISFGDENLSTTGTLASGAATLSSAKVSDLTSGRVVLAGTDGEIEDSSNLTFDGSALAVTGSVDASGSVAAGTMTIDGGSILDSSGSISFGDENLSTTGTLASGAATLASAKISDLTDNRIVIAGTAGELEDDAALTFDGTNFDIGAGPEKFRVTAASGNTIIEGSLDGNGDVRFGASGASNFTVVAASGNAATAGSLDVAGLASLDGGIDVDGAFTVADTTGNVATSGTLQAASAKIDDLTAGRVLLAGTAGELEDSANLTFNGSVLALTGAVDASGSVAAGTMTIDGGSILDASGSISFGDENLSTTGTLASGAATLASAKVSDLTDNRIVIAGAAGELEDDANFRFDGTNFDLGASGSEKFRVVVASGDVIGEGGVNFTTSTGQINLDNSGNAGGSINLNAGTQVNLSMSVFNQSAGINAKNVTGGSISSGNVLVAQGWDGGSNMIQIGAANSASDHHPIGISISTIPDANFRAIASVPGTYINGLTIAGGGAAGDAVYLNGTAMSTVAPTAGTVYRLGYLANPSASATQASMVWRPQFIAKIN